MNRYWHVGRGGIAIAVLTVALQAQATDPSVAGVLHVMVTDAKGRPISGLTTEHFVLTIDGTTVPIESIGPPPPIAAVALFDVTASTNYGRRQDEVFRSIEGAFLPVFSSPDRARIGTISRRPSLTSEFTSDGVRLLDAMRDALVLPDDERGGPSPIWDAIDLGTRVLATETGWRILLVVTDGRASGNVLGLEDAASRAALAGVTVHVIESGLLVEPDADLHRRSRTQEEGHTIFDEGKQIRPLLDHLVQTTGGLRLQREMTAGRAGLGPSVSLGESFRRIFDTMRAGYTLRFRPPDQRGRVHAVDVRVQGRDGLRVHARRLHQTNGTIAAHEP